jgi:YgiT-type zinc finger domain-containing protein
MIRQAPRCPICGGTMTEGNTTFAVDLEFGVVVVRDVPARVCDLCGDSSFSDSVAEVLEHIVDEARGSRQEVAVTRWSNAVA